MENQYKGKWVRQYFIDIFRDKILPSAESLRPTYFKHHPDREIRALWSAMNKTKEITYKELYAEFDLDYDKIKSQPFIWTRERIVTFMKKIIIDEKLGRYNPTYLATKYEFFYVAVLRSKVITFEELYYECGLVYEDEKRQKRYQKNNDAMKKLNHLMDQGIILRSKFIRVLDSALYKYLLEIGRGSFLEAIKKIGFKSEEKDRIIKQLGLDKIEISHKYLNKGFIIMLANRYEEVVSEILNNLQIGITRNNRKINGCIPDFVDKSKKLWIDTKFSTAEVNKNIRENKYNANAEFVIYIYFRKNEELITEIPNNVLCISIWEFMEENPNKLLNKYFTELIEIKKYLDLYSIVNNVSYQVSR